MEHPGRGGEPCYGFQRTHSGGSHAIFLFDPFPDIKIHLLPPDLCLLFLTEKIWDNFMS
jgi:hypothetical protein